MIKADASRGVLYAMKNEFFEDVDKEVDLKPHINYESFMHYMKGQMKEDVKNIFFPALMEALKADMNDIAIHDIDYRQEMPGYFLNTDYSIRIRMNSWSNPVTWDGGKDNPHNQYITIMRVPMIEKSGLLIHDQKRYAPIHMLEQQESISLEQDGKKNLVKIKLDGGYMIIEENPGKSPKLVISAMSSASSKKNYEAINVLFALAKDEGYDPIEVFKCFENFEIRNIFKTEELLGKAAYYYGGNKGAINASEYDDKVVPYLTGTYVNGAKKIDERYRITGIRHELNSMLSLDRAIGEVLAKDVVVDRNGDRQVIFHEGTVLTKNSILVLNSYGINVISIRKTPNIAGYYLVDNIPVDIIPRGTEIIPEIQHMIPQEQGMYVSQDCTPIAGHNFLFENTELTPGLVRFLQSQGHTSIRVSRTTGSAESKSRVIETIFLCEEVIANNHFRKSDVGFIGNGSSEWCYKNINGDYEECKDFFTTWDIAALLSLSIRLFKGECLNIISNTDTGFRKKLILPDVLYHRAFSYAVKQGFKTMSRSLREKFRNESFEFFQADRMDNYYYPFTKAFFDYLYKESKCLQPMTADVLFNPMSFISAMNKVNVFIANKHSVANKQRRIAIGFYGRIDPFETPQSGKLGVVLNATVGCKIDLDGTMRTDYYVVKHMGNKSIVTREIKSLTVEEEEKYRIADMSSIYVDKSGRILNDNDDIVLCRVPATNSLDKQSFAYSRVGDINLVNTSALQTISWTTSQIPFAGANDAARTLFGVAQGKQVKGLVHSEPPIVGTTAVSKIPRLTNEYCIFARKDGVVTLTGRNNKGDRTYDNRRGYLILSVDYDPDNPSSNDGDNFTFPEYTATKYSVTMRRIVVKEGQRVKKGDILVTSNFVNEDGALCTGTNALVCWCPTGFNYEDGVHARKGFCHKLTSYRMNEEFFKNVFPKSRIGISNLENLGKYYSKNSSAVLSYKTIHNKKTDGIEHKCYPVEAFGFFTSANVEVEKRGERNYDYKGIRANFVAVDRFSPGDKSANRHGNKGVMPQQQEDSAILRLINGRPFDMVYNPNGVGSRMNVGQILEAHLGLALYILGWRIETDAYNSISTEEVSMLLSYVVDLMDSTGDPRAICNQYPDIPEVVHQKACADIDAIRQWAGCFDKKGEAYVINPLNGNRLTETKCVVGINYIQKLIQEGAYEKHCRGGMMGGEPYVVQTDAPTKGASAHGGQRFGTMEMDALCAYGASNLIHELTNERCDNAVARNNMNVKTFLPESMQSEYLIPEELGQRRAVTQFLMTSLALGVKLDCDEGEFREIKRDNSVGVWKPETLTKVKKHGSSKYDKKKGQDDVPTLGDSNSIFADLVNMTRG